MKFTKYKLEDICHIQIGKTPRREVKEYWGKGYSWVSISDMKSRIITATKEEITESAIKECGCKLIPEGTILMSFKLSIGKLAFAGKDLYTNEAIAGLSIKDSKVLHPDYLFYVLKNIPLVGSNNAAMGATLNKESLKILQLPIPEKLSDQINIASILSKAEILITQRKQSIALLDEYLKSTYCDLFTKYEGKEIQRLESIALITSGLTKGKKYEGKTTRFLPYMRVANVQDGFLNLQEIKEIEATENEINRFNLKFGDLLLTEGGDPDKLGRGTTWKNEIIDCIFQNHIFRVRINDIKKINPVFLSYQTGSIYGKKYFLKSAKQTTGIASINSTQLKRFPVFIPPFELQTQFTQIVEKVEALKVQYQNSLQELEKLYGSISQQAFLGELSLNPASERVLMVAEPEPIYGKVIDFTSRKCSSSERAILAGHIINKTNKEDFGRVKFQKLLHLTEYFCKIDIDSNFTKKVAGPHDGELIKDIESTLKRYRFYDINQSNKGKHKVNYTPLSSVSELEEIFDSSFESERERIDSFLAKFRKSSWEQCEIISTLYAVWNNRLILNQEITDELLKQDFLDWDTQKVKYIGRLDDALQWMKTKGVIPDGWGKLIV